MKVPTSWTNLLPRACLSDGVTSSDDELLILLSAVIDASIVDAFLTRVVQNCTWPNAMSQTITHLNHNPNNKKPKFRPGIPNLNVRIMNSCKGKLLVFLVLGWGILDYPLNLTQCLCNDEHSCTNSRKKTVNKTRVNNSDYPLRTVVLNRRREFTCRPTAVRSGLRMVYYDPKRMD